MTHPSDDVTSGIGIGIAVTDSIRHQYGISLTPLVKVRLWLVGLVLGLAGRAK